MRALPLMLVVAACGGTESGMDPCTGATACDRQTVDGDQVITGSTATGYRTEIRTGAKVAEIVWSVADGATTFTYKPAGGVAGPAVTLDGTPADAVGVSRAALLLHRHGTTEIEELEKPLYTGANTLDNTSGCDQLHKFDCGPIGKCCDVHDECINASCGGQGGCGNVLLALQAAYTGTPCSETCLRCHGAVVTCMFGGSLPGPSNCCEDGNCGQAQECMIDGRVITDPCTCEDRGIPARTDCPDECPTDCKKNFEGCLPDGTPSNNSSCCCSCTVRITNNPVCACQKDCCPDFPECAPAGGFVNHYSGCCSCMVIGPGLGGTCR